MSQRTVIEVTTTDELQDEEGNTVYRLAQFDGALWKLSISEGFIILSAREGPGKVVVPAHRVREIEVIDATPREIPVEWDDEPVALVDPQGNELVAPEA
jgi:hypothetical protein